MAVSTAAPSVDKVLSCSSCRSEFPNLLEFRAHCKTEHHVHNVKRRNAGFGPISHQEWVDKLAQHENGREFEESQTAHGTSCREVHKQCAASTEPLPDCLSTQSLFDRESFETVDECLKYMQKKYSFYVPHMEQVTDLPGLLSFLGRQLWEPPHACISCGRHFPDLGSARRHMIDKGHTHVGMEVSSQGGRCFRAELLPFYLGSDGQESVSSSDDTAETVQIEELLSVPESTLVASELELKQWTVDGLMLPSGARVGCRMASRRQGLIQKRSQRLQLTCPAELCGASGGAVGKVHREELRKEWILQRATQWVSLNVQNQAKDSGLRLSQVPVGMPQQSKNRRRGKTRDTNFGRGAV